MSDNKYFIDIERSAETARLIDQANMIAATTKWLIPPGIDLTGFHTVLDVACGPGNWVMDVALHYPQLAVVGVDISERMIKYAQARAKAQSLENVSFAVADVTKPLGFHDASFDLVNARFIAGFMQPAQWPLLIAECKRVLRPGGYICLTEGEWGISNSRALQTYTRHISYALWRAGQSFSIDGHDMGITPMLGKLLRDAGFEEQQNASHAFESSYGAEGHLPLLQDYRSLFLLSQPFLLKMGVASQQELDSLYEQVLAEMQEESFCNVGFYLSVWGKRSGEGREQ